MEGECSCLNMVRMLFLRQTNCKFFGEAYRLFLPLLEHFQKQKNHSICKHFPKLKPFYYTMYPFVLYLTKQNNPKRSLELAV